MVNRKHCVQVSKCSVCTPPHIVANALYLMLTRPKWPPAENVQPALSHVLIFLRRDSRGILLSLKLFRIGSEGNMFNLFLSRKGYGMAAELWDDRPYNFNAILKNISGLLPRILGRRLLRGMRGMSFQWNCVKGCSEKFSQI